MLGSWGPQWGRAGQGRLPRIPCMGTAVAVAEGTEGEKKGGGQSTIKSINLRKVFYTSTKCPMPYSGGRQVCLVLQSSNVVTSSKSSFINDEILLYDAFSEVYLLQIGQCASYNTGGLYSCYLQRWLSTEGMLSLEKMIVCFFFLRSFIYKKAPNWYSSKTTQDM